MKLKSGNLQEGIDALSRELLEGAFQKGIESFLRTHRLPKELVERVIPTHEVVAVLDNVTLRHRAARGSIGQFVGTLGNPLQAESSNLIHASDCLRAMAARYALDPHIAEPLAHLANAVADWEALLDRLTQQLSTDPSLRSIVRKRRWVLAFASLLVVGILGGAAGFGFWQHVVVTGARDRIDALLARSTPCAEQEISAKDLTYALTEQTHRLDERMRACAVYQEKQAYLADCAALADHVSAGKLNDRDEVIAGSSLALIHRILSSELLVDDLMVDADSFPCQDTQDGKRLWDIYARKVADSVTLWNQAESVSDHVRSLLTGGNITLSEPARQTLITRVESHTRRAITKGHEPDLERSRNLCSLVVRLGYPKDDWCRALERIDRRAGKNP